MTRFRLTVEACADLTEIFDYIAEDSVDAAQRVAVEVHKELEKLARNPGIGHKAAGPNEPRSALLARLLVSNHLPTHRAYQHNRGPPREARH